ncbi:MAG TPA: S-layer family protein, partial [Candidatus Caenarcaniphilales bacterium]
DPINLPTSDITAISQTDPALAGQVSITTPDVDPSRGLVTLPEAVVDVSGLITQGCAADVATAPSQFMITGRGGLPSSPQNLLKSESSLVELGTPAQATAQARDILTQPRSSSAGTARPTSPTPAPIVEAQGWRTAADGKVILTAQAPSAPPHSAWLPPATCQGS